MANGIWVRLVVEGDTVVTGFVAGAESPNDFWVTFKSQLIRLERVIEELRNGTKVTHARLYVNRDYVILASVANEPKGQ
ncbi:MAG TPA: hypothetical protein VFY93_12490 [Planctomycetota bacterium]|nr:hypothetical protein [Planctomycetota bacterium]